MQLGACNNLEVLLDDVATVMMYCRQVENTSSEVKTSESFTEKGPCHRDRQEVSSPDDGYWVESCTERG